MNSITIQGAALFDEQRVKRGEVGVIQVGLRFGFRAKALLQFRVAGKLGS